MHFGVQHLFGGLISCLALTAGAASQYFNISRQPAVDALVEFTEQSGVEILYSPDQLREYRSTAVHGKFEPADALVRLLRATDFTVIRRDGRFFIKRLSKPRGELVGKFVPANGEAPAGTLVHIPELQYRTRTNRQGEYHFDRIPFGNYTVTASREGFKSLTVESVAIASTERSFLASQTLTPQEDGYEMETLVVEGRLNHYGPMDPGPTVWGPRRAGGNLDLNRTMNDALPFLVYDRDRIVRSGAVNLNEFLRRELLDTDATSLPPEQSIGSDATAIGSSNLSLRGFSDQETVVLVNGRRLPEVLTVTSGPQAPDVSFIPLSLVQQVQVLPASASALYSGNAVGGVINILLRPDTMGNHTEVTTTYTNATENFDAATSYLSVLHNQVLLDGKLSFRLNANFIDSNPATESELNYRRGMPNSPVSDGQELFGATPNIRTTDGRPLSAQSLTSVASVPPGSEALTDPASGLGIRNYDAYDSPGTIASATGGLDYPYGRQQSRDLYYVSTLYEMFPALELGLDAAYSSTVINRGYQVYTDNLKLAADHVFNPYDEDIIVSLFETPTAVGQDYDEATLDFYSLVGSALVTLPWELKLVVDAQYSQSATRFRGIEDINHERWQSLVDRGLYNPLRDTQTVLAPEVFYDEAVVFTQGRGEFATIGDYETFDGAARLTQEELPLPTGKGVFNLGADYRISTLGGFDGEFRYGDGSTAKPAERWRGRTLERVSFFSELQAPLLPRNRLPAWIRSFETDLAARYIMADTSAETNLAPTIALKLGLSNGLTLRGSFTTSNRYPTPFMSSRIGNGLNTGTGAQLIPIFDPQRGERYLAESRSVINGGLQSENAVTQTFGVIYERGDRNRFRASVDFFDTRKTNEIVGLGATELLNLESYFGELVERAPLQPGDSSPVGRVQTFYTTSANLANRHSQNWMGTLDFARRDVWGGNLELRGRLMFFQKFERTINQDDSAIDEIHHPSGSAASLLEYRATFGGGWSNRDLSFGLDGQYFHSRQLPVSEWAGHGARTIDPYWQADLYAQANLGRWLLPEDSRLGLKGQLRVNNVFKHSYPTYGNAENGSGVQPYGDWRGRTFSISLTAEF